MTLTPAPLHSRFGRRLLLLFVGCAVLPLAAGGAIAYVHLVRGLRDQTERRLHQADKALALAIYERLLLVDGNLTNIPPGALGELMASRAPEERGRPETPSTRRDATAMLAHGLDMLVRRQFMSLAFLGDDGRWSTIFGASTIRPDLTAADRDNLRAGLPLLLSLPADTGRARTLLLRRVDQTGGVRGTLVGEISPKFLWATLESSMPSPSTSVSVVNDSGRVLFRSTQAELASEYDPIDELAPLPPGSSSPLAPIEPAYVTAAAPIVLDEVFASSNWTLVLGENRDEVLGPVAELARTFFGILMLASVGALVISRAQIRRSLVPLARLRAGTGRIAQREFSSRVEVSSRDEFEELAASFNEMAGELGRQFHALATAADLDRSVLSSTDVGSIVDTVVARTRDVFPCHLLGITLITPDGRKSSATVVYDYCDDIRHAERMELHAEDIQGLLSAPGVMAYDTGAPDLPAYLTPVLRHGLRLIRVLPLRCRQQLVGILLVGERAVSKVSACELAAAEVAPDEEVQLRRFADQIAVALTNAHMLEQVRLLAYYDNLTGLPNRLSYKERLAEALEQAQRSRRHVAAFFIDLDHFSRINDTLGHEAGDQLLQQVALRLRGSCRDREDECGPAQDAISADVARLGGDEFTILITGLTRPEDAGKLARRILSSLAQPFRVTGQEVFVNASIGIAVYPQDGEDLETLLMHADTAMYKAKEQGGNSYQSYSRTMNASALQRLTLENALRRALERSEFELHYQPIVDGRDGVLVGAEALIRWRHPELGLLLPSEFIPLAEENGLIVPLGEWVLHEACTQNRAWQAAGLRPIRVDVNLSSRQLRTSLPESIARILATTGLDARYLGLELTESLLVETDKEYTDVLHAFRAMGLHLAIDDFGIGFSSFSYLKHLPLDALKIDRSFVREITTSPDDAAITTAIIAMAHALGLTVVGEGIETTAQHEVLRAQGCDTMQGYLFSRPVPAGELAALLAVHPMRTRPVTRRLRSA